MRLDLDDSHRCAASLITNKLLVKTRECRNQLLIVMTSAAPRTFSRCHRGRPADELIPVSTLESCLPLFPLPNSIGEASSPQKTGRIYPQEEMAHCSHRRMCSQSCNYWREHAAPTPPVEILRLSSPDLKLVGPEECSRRIMVLSVSGVIVGLKW